MLEGVLVNLIQTIEHQLKRSRKPEKEEKLHETELLTVDERISWGQHCNKNDLHTVSSENFTP